MSKPHYDGSLCLHGCAGVIGLEGAAFVRGCWWAGLLRVCGGDGVAGGIPLTFGLV